jgi:hypothetical protein
MPIFYSRLFTSENIEELSTSVAAMELGSPSLESDVQFLYVVCTNGLAAGLILASLYLHYLLLITNKQI